MEVQGGLGVRLLSWPSIGNNSYANRVYSGSIVSVFNVTVGVSWIGSVPFGEAHGFQMNCAPFISNTMRFGSNFAIYADFYYPILDASRTVPFASFGIGGGFGFGD